MILKEIERKDSEFLTAYPYLQSLDSLKGRINIQCWLAWHPFFRFRALANLSGTHGAEDCGSLGRLVPVQRRGSLQNRTVHGFVSCAVGCPVLGHHWNTTLCQSMPSTCRLLLPELPTRPGVPYATVTWSGRKDCSELAVFSLQEHRKLQHTAPSTAREWNEVYNEEVVIFRSKRGASVGAHCGSSNGVINLHLTLKGGVDGYACSFLPSPR